MRLGVEITGVVASNEDDYARPYEHEHGVRPALVKRGDAAGDTSEVETIGLDNVVSWHEVDGASPSD